MPELILQLDLSPEQLLAYYRGQARRVRVRATNGQVVVFPASVLQRQVAADGVRGAFRLIIDEHHKFVALERLPAAAPLGCG